MIDKWPSKHRIKTIREDDGTLIGFGVTAPGGKTIVKRFRREDLGAALAALNQTCDFIYGPLRTYQEALT